VDIEDRIRDRVVSERCPDSSAWPLILLLFSFTLGSFRTTGLDTLILAFREACYRVRWIISECPVIRPESMPSAEITSYKPTSRYQSPVARLDYFRIADDSPNNRPGPGIVKVKVILRQWFHRYCVVRAALDVFVQEPLPAAHPFTRLENAVMTCHLGWPTDLTYSAFTDDCGRQIEMGLRGDRSRVDNP